MQIVEMSLEDTWDINDKIKESVEKIIDDEQNAHLYHSFN